MKAQEFVDLLAAMTPSMEPLKKRYSANGFKRIAESYIVRPKPQPGQDYQDDVLKLVEKFQMKNVSALDIRFDEEVTEEAEFYKFGEYDIFYLVVVKSTGRVACYDYTIEAIGEECALDGDRFLDAMLHVRQTHTKRIVENIDMMDDTPKDDSDAYICALKAGSEDYLGFYQELLWVG